MKASSPLQSLEDNLELLADQALTGDSKMIQSHKQQQIIWLKKKMEFHQIQFDQI